ncbi:hypothetical protein [Erythrobacter colymbi]|uniref:hypothetical protein n=1 Tax=Erythrobacter colymbi TaxID=1161202 RepID=UPI00117DA131|nr:hypothetical protein [Erythrobacter colymbi]
MGTPVITSQTTVMCGHGGSATHVPTNMRVRIASMPVAVASDQHVVAGCSLSSVPSTPCTTLTWSVPALRVKAGGVPVLVQTSVPMGIGPGVVAVGQVRVMAT